jgi:hypothetical protein
MWIFGVFSHDLEYFTTVNYCENFKKPSDFAWGEEPTNNTLSIIFSRVTVLIRVVKGFDLQSNVPEAWIAICSQFD